MNDNPDHETVAEIGAKLEVTLQAIDPRVQQWLAAFGKANVKYGDLDWRIERYEERRVDGAMLATFNMLRVYPL